MTSSRTPATLAGTAFISTDDGYAALPPGTYRPTRCSGVMRWPRRVPSASVYSQEFCSCRSWKALMRWCATRSACPCAPGREIFASGRSRSFREDALRSEEHTSELQSPCNLVCRLLLEKKKKKAKHQTNGEEYHTNTT